MNYDVLSVGALVVVLIISCVSKFNVGLLGMGFAFILAMIAHIKLGALYKGFPVGLFITLVGVTFMFSIALLNGTIEKITNFFIRMVRGQRGMMPIVFFLIAFIVPSIGPGPIESLAIMAPPAMAMAWRIGINPLLMGLAITCGVEAAGCSPVSVGGVFANQLVAPLNIGVSIWRLYANQAIAHTFVFIVAYLLFGGPKLWMRDEKSGEADAAIAEIMQGKGAGFKKEHILTLIGIAILITCALMRLDVGLTALIIGLVLVILKAGDEDRVIKSMPRGVIMMVCGVTVLIGLMKITGGMKVFTDLMASISTPLTSTFIVAFIPGVISIYSSTIGVVLPAFVPIIPDLAKTIGGDVDPKALLYALYYGSSVVDVSPLSTLGALVLAAATPEMDKIKLYRGLLIWGVSMSVVGSAVAWLLFGVLKI